MGIGRAVRRALIAAAFAFVLVPGSVAQAQVFGVAGYEQVTQPLGVLSGQFATVAAVCPAGKAVVGGGFDVGTSGTIEVSVSGPVNSGNLATDRWQLSVRNAGMITQQVTVVAECADPALPGYEVRQNLVSVLPGAATNSTVLCSAGKKVLGGGFQLETASAFKLFSSLPTNGQSTFIDNGWNVFAQNIDTLTRQMLAFAVCVNDNVSGYERQVSQPNVAPGATLNVSATCAVHKKVTGGGFRVETPDDVQVLSAEPGNDQGVAIDNGWTSRFRNVGSTTRGVSVAAICVDPQDVTPPDTTITSGPAGPTNDTTPTFAFTSTEAGTFECRVDTAAFATCASPFTTAALTNGAHTFQVRAVDTFGNVDPSPASRSFTVDTVAPDTTITSGPAGPTNDTTPTFAFTSTEAGTFECRVDTAAFAACTSPFTTAALTNGAHTFQVRATDAAGNVNASPASRSFTVDTVAPDTTITSGPAGPTNDTTPTFAFTSTEAGTFECRVDTAAFAACTSPFTTAALTNGAHTFQVRATDAAGNVDASPASRSFTVDAIAPDTTITSGPAGPTNDTTPTFAFTSTEAGTFECRVDTAAFAACASPFTTAVLTDGAHTFQVRATDGVGNVDASPASRSFTVDTIAPDTTITSGPAGPTNDTTPTFAFTSTEAGSTFECRVDTAAFATCTSPFTTAALTNGAHTFEVIATDAAGNADASPDSRSFTVDTAPPQTTIDDGPSGTTPDATPTLAFSSSEPGSTFECRVDGGAFEACSSPFTTPTLPEGPHTFEVRALDVAGNASAPVSRSFSVAAPTPPPPPVPPVPPLPPPVADADADGIPDADDESDASAPPRLAETVIAREVSGEVFVRRPAGAGSRSAARAAQAGTPRGYVPLKGAEVLPVGTIVHAVRGRLALTSAASRLNGRTQTQRAEFYRGIFQIRQRRARLPTTDIHLRSANYVRDCGSAARAATAASASGPFDVFAAQARRRSKKVVSRLWGNGKGRFRTIGRHSAATVRGTTWLTEERCDGTLTRVTRGVVSVRDNRARRTVTVRAGRSYLARAVRATVRTRRP